MENQEEVPLSRSPVDFFVKPEQISGPFFDPYTINFPSVSEAVPSGIPVSISGTRYVFSVILEHAQEYASQRSSSSKGSSLSLQRLFLSFPFGTRVSTDGMDGTDSGWRSLLSKFRLILFHDF